MPMFRKKPVVIEARRFTENEADQYSVANWCSGSLRGVRSDVHVLCIRTLEGEMLASIGDWIIKGVKGEFYPCKVDIFEATYEEVG